jgi:peptide/nickel transport system substrate-binding protein
LPWHLGYNKPSAQLPFDVAQAAAHFDAAGWKVGTDGLRAKDGNPLKLQLATAETDIYPQLARGLQEQWRKVGIQVDTKLLSVEQLQQDYLRPRKYDLMLFGVALGADPDVYSYWHSSQVKYPGLNISRYKSQQADLSLESARARSDVKLRAAKYEAFMKSWRQDAPAIAIYRPSFLYAVQNYVQGINITNLISPGDRFYNVEDWSVNTQPVLKRLAE